MEPSPDPGTEPALGEGHYTVVLAGAGQVRARTRAVDPERLADEVPGDDGPCGLREIAVIGHVKNDGGGENIGGQSERPSVNALSDIHFRLRANLPTLFRSRRS